MNIKEIHDKLVNGIKWYAFNHNFVKAVIGISGGIDSATTTTLAVEALGKNNVIGIHMPSHITSEQNTKDANILANNLGISLKIVTISDIYRSYLIALNQEFKNTNEDITGENIQARIRANILMAFSNKFGYLVLNSGNKSELYTGYCTLYGDLAGGLAVLSDLYKTNVYELAHYINKKKEIIPNNIIIKEPSAELKHGQKDTDFLPEYHVLDKILHAYLHENKTKEEIVKLGFDKNIVEKIIRMIKKSEFKRKQAPPGIKIS